MYWIWFPIEASKKHFNSTHGAFDLFYNGINLGAEKEASDAYCWVISVLFGAWVFYGYGKTCPSPSPRTCCVNHTLFCVIPRCMEKTIC
jgi:hypothetical protein